MADPKTVILAYRRVSGDLSSGSILLSVGSSPPEVLCLFENLDFKVMMREFAIELNEHPDAGGAIQRTDRPGLVQIPLAQDEVDLFRHDPVEAIRRRTIPPQRVVVGIDRTADPDKTPDKTVVQVRTPEGAVLEAGYNSLAQCFGDIVYARARLDDAKPAVECHCCGSWALLEGRDSYTCRECNQKLPVAELVTEWAGVRVSDLLQTDREVFFLPRAWNGYKNWATRSDLERRYNEYNKEKTSCTTVARSAFVSPRTNRRSRHRP
jgi:hypothetical protein